MVIASRGLGKPGGWRTFPKHRIIRIVPLYWLLTTGKIAAVLVLPVLVIRTGLDPLFLIRSYLFLPVVDSAGHFRPAIPVGWTLTYEFLFYTFFATALALRVDVLKVAIPALGLVAALAIARTDTWPEWTILFNTIVIEFVFGVVIAKWTLVGFRVPVFLAAACVVAGFAGILSLLMLSEHIRPLSWGVPAFFIVSGAVSLEPIVSRVLPRWLLSLRDASYSIYLSHGFVLTAFVYLAGRSLSPAVANELIAVMACVVGSALVGWLLFVSIENPMIRPFRSRPLKPSLLRPVAA